MPAARDHLIVFDLGGVLMRLCTGWADACARAGVQVALRTPEGDDVARLRHTIQQSDAGQIDEDAFARIAGEVFGLTAQQVMQLSAAYLLGPYPGAVALLDDLLARGIPTACLSNTNSLHWRQMTTPGGSNYLPLERMNWRFASFQIGLRKPDAAIYAHVEQQTGFAPGQITFFDDRPENIDTATARGWRAVQILGTADPIRQIIATLSSLPLPGASLDEAR